MHRLSPGSPTEQQFDPDDAEREQIDPVVLRFPLPLLGRGIAGRAPSGTIVSDRLVEGRGDAEVHELHLSPAVDEDVPGFHVPVDDALSVRCRGLVVCVVECFADLPEHVERGPWRERTMASEQLSQGGAFDQLHGDEGPSMLLAHVVDLRDVRMMQPGDQPGFPQEHLGLVLAVGAEHLECDGLAEARRADQVGSEHLGGAPLSEHAQELVPPPSERSVFSRESVEVWRGLCQSALPVAARKDGSAPFGRGGV